MSTLTIQPRDRLGFTLFVAAAIHAAIVLGVSFSSDFNFRKSPTIEVTMALSNDDAPEKADFLAQANQQGSGDLSEIQETTTTERSAFHDNQLQETLTELPSAPPQTVLEKRELLTTVSEAEDQTTTEDVTEVEELPPQLPEQNEQYESLAQEIASLEARIAQEQQARAKAPRIKRLTSVSTKTASEAAYLNMWRQKVERIGNANFPAQGVFGDLRLLVVLKDDGTLSEVRLLQSSGHKVLDQAALRIVRLAAPFQEFPVEMRKTYDQLEIIRTWKFSRAGSQIGG